MNTFISRIIWSKLRNSNRCPICLVPVVATNLRYPGPLRSLWRICFLLPILLPGTSVRLGLLAVSIKVPRICLVL